MRIRTAIIAVIVTLSLFLSGMRAAIYASLSAIPAEHLLNPDGTLRIDSASSGTLDVSGW